MMSVRPILRVCLPLSQWTNCMHSSPILSSTFHEQDPKFGYSKLDPNRKQPLREKIQMYKDGIQDLKTGVKKWKEEFHDTLDPQVDITPHETQVIWKFDESTINKWIVTCDSDNREGLSTANLSVSTLGHGMFSGTINSHVPQDGKLKRSGYCNLRSTRHRKSFEREDYYEWPLYTHLVIRCRGDGRSFMINLHTPGEFDLTWGDMYSYLLYTRGGPYWQVSKIPFSKFFFQSKGRVQDLQDPLPIDRVSSIGLSMMDQNNGPFQLELDYIGVEFDPSHDEEFAYEMYLLENEVRGIVHWTIVRSTWEYGSVFWTTEKGQKINSRYSSKLGSLSIPKDQRVLPQIPTKHRTQNFA